MLVQKQDGNIKMYLDFRAVNAHLAQDAHLLPRFEDLKEAYFLVALDKESRDYHL